MAVTPDIVGRPTITNPSFSGTRNTMMYDVTVTVDGTGADASHAAVVGYVADSDYTACDATVGWKWSHAEVFDDTDTRTWTLYDFVPGTVYRYKVVVGDPSGTVRVRCGILRTKAAPTPTLPPDLAALNLQYELAGASHPSEAKYIILETDDCGFGSPRGAKYYVVAVDPAHEAIVWYLDIAALTGLSHATGSGYRYEPGVTPDQDRLLMTVDQRFLYEWTFDGTEKNFWDFAPSDECDGRIGSSGPCVNHDVFQSDSTGNTYVLVTRASGVDATGTAWEDKCGTGSRFLEDGFRVLDPSWSVASEEYLMADYGYDPAIDGGPGAAAVAARRSSCDSNKWRSFDPEYGVIEWTHANSLSASSFGSTEVIDLSLREWDQVIRFDAATGDRLWSLSSNAGYSDWGSVQKAAGIVGKATFQGQHDVHAVGPDTLIMLDNRGEAAGSRVLEIELTTDPLAATIQKSWALVDASGSPIVCPTEGTAERLQGSTDDHVLALCAHEFAFVELDDPTGNVGEPPPLFVHLPDGSAEPICTSGGPTSRHDIHGWHKGYPAARIGEF
jgi:hypothetical protein